MAPLRLADIHRTVGLIENAVDIGMRGDDRNACGGARGDAAATEHEAQAIDRVFQRSRLGTRVSLTEIPQQHRELVAAEAADHVGGTYLVRYRGNDRLQHLVAGRVPEGIVDRLEAVDVEHDQRAGRLIALDEGERPGELALEAATIEDVEQEVGLGRGLQLDRKSVV